MLVVQVVVQNCKSANGYLILVCQKKSCLGMPVEWVFLLVEAPTLIHLQGWHPLRNIAIDPGRQLKKIPDLLAIIEIHPDDFHDVAV